MSKTINKPTKDKEKKKKNIHEVSFKNNKLELGLFHDIKMTCGYLGVSGWMKVAAFEKIQREINGDTYMDDTMGIPPKMMQMVQHSQQSQFADENKSKSPLEEKQLSSLMDSINFM